MRRLWPGLLALVVAGAFSVWAYPHLPAEVATHFDGAGEPNGWSSRLMAALMVPGLGLLAALIFVVVPQIDPRRANYALFGSTYALVVNAVLLLLAAVHIVVLGKAMGWAIDVGRVASFGVGGLFVLLGNVMTRIRPNWFMGIRTPWTLSSDTVWRKTHRFGGIAFVVAGLALIATGLAGASWLRYGAIGGAVVAGLGSVLYSYVVWRQEQPVGIPTDPAADDHRPR